MPKITIVTDSTAYLPPAVLKQYDIQVAPLFVNWDGVSYLDGVDIHPAEFYTRLARSKTMPTSSQVPVSAFQKIFADLIARGDSILAITISSKLSGTLDSAIQAKASFPNASIELFDSLATTLGTGVQVLVAARAIEKGASLADCKTILEGARAKSGILITVDTLEFLHRGGRIGGGARFLGTALNLKPILALGEQTSGKIEAVERVRTRSKVLSRMVEVMAERLNGRKLAYAATVHANALVDAQAVIDQVKAKFHPAETMIAEVSPVIGTHTGPGTVGLIYLAE